MKKMTMMKARTASLFYLKRTLKVKLTAFLIIASICDAQSENYDRNTKISKELPLYGLMGKSTDQKKVEGVVKDNKGMPLTGVTVSVNGSKQGTVTNFDGKYEIAVNEGDVVSFSFVGFETKTIKITNQVLLNVTLEPSTNKLDELVLVGYGKMSRDKITGAVTKLDTKVLKNTQNVSFADALIGVVPGLFVQENFASPDAPPSILLRGIGSISASTDPLIVVDGVQMPRSGLGAFALNAADIQEISVLKDAASTSIYGSKGTNGVIMITTKRGNRNNRLQVTFNTRLGVKTADQSFTNDLMTGSQKLDFEESLGFYKTNPALLQSRRALGKNVNWADLLLKNEVNRENDISFSGGSDKANYYTSVTYNKVDNIFGGDYTRYTASTRIDFDLGRKLKVGFSGNFGNVKDVNKRTVGSPFSNAFMLNPWLSFLDNKGNPLRLLDVGSAAGVPYNPLFVRDNTIVNSNRKNIGGSVNLTYTPFKWLSLNGVLGANYNNSKGSTFEKVLVKGGTLTSSSGDNNNYTATLTATIAKKFEKHSFDLVLGNEVNEYETNSLSVLANTFNSDAIQIISAAKTITSATEQKSQAGSLSYFSRLNYNFDNTYNLSLSFRRDGSSRFGANNKYANFWSVGTSWNAYKNLFKENKIVSSLKFRASIGTSGNDFIGDFASQSLYSYSSLYVYAGSTVPYLSRGENPNLTWEKNYNKNFGIDYGLFNNRISGTVDYYIRDTRDLLNNKPVPLTSGFKELISNIGNFRNEGVEISLHTVNLKGKDFNWTTDFNIALNKGTVLALSDKKDIINNAGSTVFQEGSAIRSFYIADWAGVNPVTGFNQYRTQDGTLVDYNTNKTTTNLTAITNLRQVSNKTAMPKYYGGLTNTFRYKQLDLSVLISYAGGHYVLNEGIYNLYNNPAYNQSTAVLNAWKNSGDQSNIAVRQVNTVTPTAFLESDYKNSTQFLENASYIKLKNLALGYTLQKNVLEKTGIESLRIYVQGQNLFTKTAVTYIDPEYATAAGGIGLSSFIVRAYSLGFNASF
ncbi:SusC/RagA family TonB-linked outer membrane protein [Flavobacterium lipolyticum]|uniref:SusC/RagA family TonB-linked outer membrane protein n=1 Tax=Flavobacterium lipolyticum TaxID=2893754 RepID=A0ABS8M1H1_9FLAO|nr:SusC/RagA family TonB-linked outer membrane protein [Flavobacterium sp. F-126]MCC9018691.1 SusC/RagA family TonB-linked outer membrane protein [Flavobacterium sp. F-126]